MAYIYPANFTPQRRNLGAYLLNGPRRPRRRGIRGMGDDTTDGTLPLPPRLITFWIRSPDAAAL